MFVQSSVCQSANSPKISYTLFIIFVSDFFSSVYSLIVCKTDSLGPNWLKKIFALYESHPLLLPRPLCYMSSRRKIRSPPSFFCALYPTQQQQLCKTCKAPKISCTRPGLVRSAGARQVQGARGPLQLGTRAPQSAHAHKTRKRKEKTRKKKCEVEDWLN